MAGFLKTIRDTPNHMSQKRQTTNTILILFLGIVLGTVSKYLDCTASNELPHIIEYLDVSNFLGRFAIWIFLAVCISVYSKTAMRASIHVFLFFVGMVGSYYVYSKFIAGFFPKSYAMIWIALTILSPILANICWYAKGNGKTAIFISALIIAVQFNVSFVYGLTYFDVVSPLELVTFLFSIAVLWRPIKETGIMVGAGIVLAVVLNITAP